MITNIKQVLTHNNTNDKLESSIYVDHNKNDATVVENYQYSDDGSYKKTVDSSATPDTQKIISVDKNSNISNVEIKNKATGEITQDAEFAQATSPNITSGANTISSGGTTSSGGPTNSDIAADEAQLAQLQTEQAATQEDLTSQQASYEQTSTEKEQEVGTIEGQINTEQGNLATANEEQGVAQECVETATSECEQAQAEVDTAQDEVDSTQSALDEATNEANEAQGAQETAAANQSQAASEEQAAQADSNTANSELSSATAATNTASSEKQAAAADLSSAMTKTSAAFNVKTQKDQAVASAERAYQSAQAEKNGKSKNAWDAIKGAWNAICSKVSQLWSKLTGAKNEQKAATEDYKNKKTDEDKKRVIDEKAEAELEKRQNEQDTAQSVADAAQVVLDAKTGAREVSDQELADALLDLADALMTQEGAATEHDGALNAFMEANNYKVDADGNLVDAQGKLVSCQEVVAGLETLVSDLSNKKTTTENSYNQVLDTTVAVIKGDEQKIQQLGTEIQALQTNIEEKKAELALQEEMVAQLTTERGDVNAYGEKDTEDKYWSDRKKLEEAIMSGDSEAIKEAYKALYGDKDVVVDASGNVVDASTLSEEELAKCTTKKVSELGSAQLSNKVELEKACAAESAEMAKMLASGAFSVDGQSLSQEELNEALIKQAEDQIAELEKAMNEQGIISKGVGALNNLIGIGTTGKDAQYEVERYKRLVEQLKDCKNPTQYAALYKQVTGNNFSASEIIQLSAYRKANNMPSSPTTSKVSQVESANKVDLSGYVNQTLEACKGKDGEVDASLLKKTGNSKGAEAIADYKETQKNIVEGAKGVVVGAVSAAIAVAAVAASPFTGGASLLALAAVGAAVGAGTNVALGAIDSIYDTDGDGSIDFNYTLDDLSNDAITGALTGSVSAVTSGVGDKVSGAITSKASGAIATTGKEAVKQSATRVAGKIAGEAAEGAIDGTLSAAGDYTYAAIQEGTFTLGGLAKAAGQGGAIGGTMGAIMGTAEGVLSETKHFIDGKIMQSKVDDILTMGGTKKVVDIDDTTSVIDYKKTSDTGLSTTLSNNLAETPDLKLENVIANNLDSKYIKDGQVNKWSINQITQDAKNAQKALKQAGLADNALDVLNNVSTDNYSDIPKITSLLSDQDNMKVLGLTTEGKKGSLDADKASNFISGLDEVKTRANGSIEEITSYGLNGQKVSLEFDEKGKVLNMSIADDIASQNNKAHLLGDITDIKDVDINPDKNSNVIILGDGDVITPDAKPSTNINSGSTETISRPDLDKYIDKSSSSKSYTVSDNAKEYIAEEAAGRYQDEIQKLIQKQQKGLIPYNVNIQEMAKQNVDSYVEHMEFFMGRRDLFSDMNSNSHWAQFTPTNQEHGAWKMHVFADSEADWQNLADKIAPYLRDNDVEWKTSLDLDFSDANQRGKAFTIYPRNNEQMAQIAKDLDYIIKGNDLTINSSKIIGDNNLGDSGRLFYRYEFKSGADKDLILDLANDADYQNYKYNYYEANRGSGKYLADDMTLDDDIWANFNPSDPNSTYKISSDTVINKNVADNLKVKKVDVTQNNVQDHWAKMSTEEKTKFVQSLKNTDGTARFRGTDDIEFISEIMDDSPKATSAILNAKNADGSYMFNSATQIDIASRVMEKHPDEVTKIIDLKDIDGTPRVKSVYNFDEMAYLIKEYPDEIDTLLNAKNSDGSYMFDLGNGEGIYDVRNRAKSLSFKGSGLNNPPAEYNVKDLSKKIKELKKSGYLTNDIDIKNISKNPGMIDNDLLRDIDTMYSAMQKGVTIEDTFTPKYASTAAAASSLNTGDVCRVGNSNNVSIKLADGTIEELNMSYEKYLELFPPVSQYVSNQQNIGDCYLVSSIDQLYKTPETKANVLRSFTENADGSVTVKLPNGQVSFTIPKGSKVDDYVVKEMLTSNGTSKRGNFIMNASEGYKALEYTYGLELVQKEVDNITDMLAHDASLTASDIEVINKALLNYSDPEFVRTFSAQMRNQGGHNYNVFQIFGLETRGCEDFFSAQSVLTNPDNWSEYIIGGGTKGRSDTMFLNKNLQLAERHAYSIEPFVADDLGQVMYKVTNPWQGTNNVILSLDEIKEYFDQFYIAKKV